MGFGGQISTGPLPLQAAGQFSRSGQARPPWSTESRVRELCTSCGDCIAACPEAILRAGPAGTPVVDFAMGACTFCGVCADACSENVFDLAGEPWRIVAALGTACLLEEGVSCRTCTDACDARALRFDLRAAPMGRVRVDADACTGCGACVGVCPVGAIAMIEPKPVREAVS